MFIGLATEHHDTYGVARKPLRSFLSKMHFEITKFDSAKKFWRKAAGGKNTFYFDFICLLLEYYMTYRRCVLCTHSLLKLVDFLPKEELFSNNISRGEFFGVSDCKQIILYCSKRSHLNR